MPPPMLVSNELDDEEPNPFALPDALGTPPSPYVAGLLNPSPLPLTVASRPMPSNKDGLSNP